MNTSDAPHSRFDISRIRNRCDEIAARLHDRLCDSGQDLQDRLPRDLDLSHHKLRHLLASLLDTLEAACLPETGRHRGASSDWLHIDPHHYVLIGEVLLETLEKELGDLSDAARHAWVKAFTLITDTLEDRRDEAAEQPANELQQMVPAPA